MQSDLFRNNAFKIMLWGKNVSHFNRLHDDWKDTEWRLSAVPLWWHLVLCRNKTSFSPILKKFVQMYILHLYLLLLSELINKFAKAWINQDDTWWVMEPFSKVSDMTDGIHANCICTSLLCNLLLSFKKEYYIRTFSVFKIWNFLNV